MVGTVYSSCTSVVFMFSRESYCSNITIKSKTFESILKYISLIVIDCFSSLHYSNDEYRLRHLCCVY